MSKTGFTIYSVFLCILMPLLSFGALTNSEFDLSESKFDSRTVHTLETKWEIYWEQLLKPKDFHASGKAKLTGYIHYPKLWTGQKIGEKSIVNNSFATYRLRVKLPDQVQVYGIKIPELSTAYILYVNGAKLHEHGVVSNDPKLTKLKAGNKELHFLHYGGVAEFVLNISSYHHKDGGTRRPIKIGTSEAIRADGKFLTVLDAFLIGTMFIMAFYHIVIFLLKRDAYSSVFFAAFCALVGIHTATAGSGGFVTTLLPDLSFQVYKKIQYLGFYLAVPAIISFLYTLYPEEQFKLFPKVVWTVAVLFALTVVATPASIFSWTTGPYQIFTAVVCTFTIVQCFLAAFRGREGAIAILLGLLVVVGGLFLDILDAEGVINKPVPTTALGLYVLIYLQSVLLSRRYTKLHMQMDDYKTQNITLKDLDRQKTSFFQNLSHEIRTPLTLIMGPLEIASEQYKDDNSIKMALKNSRRLIKLVNQFLNFQEVLSGKNETPTMIIDLVPFLRSCAEHFKKACKSKHISFELDLNSSGWVFINGKIDYLEKIIYNYLANALKFTPHSGRIELKLEDLGEQARISVRDSGIGINEKDKAKLFEMFGQVRDSTNGAHEGSGLGLPLVKKLAEEMNGRVGLDSHPGTGSTFWVEFGISDSKLPILDVLFVDDDPEIRGFFELNMIEYGNTSNYQIVEDAFEARKIIESHRVKCLVSDMVMDKEDGVELIKYVDEVQPNCIKLMVTGATNPELLKKAINVNKIKRVIEKPWNPKEFVALIEQYLSESLIEDDIVADTSEYLPKDWNFTDFSSDEVLNLMENRLEPIAKHDQTVMVLDDVADIRNVVEKILKYNGYKVKKVKNLSEAEQSLRNSVVDLIVLDWKIGEDNGLVFVDKLKKKKEYAGIPTVMLSARNDIESKIEFLDRGSTAFISKPFDSRELVGVVGNLLELKKSEYQLREFNRFLSENVLKKYLPAAYVDKIIDVDKEEDLTAKVMPISVLVVDLCNLRQRSSTIGPSRMAEILKPYFEKINKVILNNSGVIDKYLEDTVIVLFGAMNSEDASSQTSSAINCAYEMMDALESMQQEKNLDISDYEYTMRIGIHHGPAMVGTFGSEDRSEFMAVGHTVQHAIAIKDTADSGQILTSEIVRDLLPRDSWEKAGLYDLHGSSNQTVLFELKAQDHNKKAA